MKKLLAVLLGVILVFSAGITAFADAMAYDVEQAGYYVYVLTPDGGLNMRNGPGTEYNKVLSSTIPDYTRLYIELVSKNWGYTSYNGTYGWVALSQTTTKAPEQHSKTPAGYTVYVTTPDGGLNIRSGPGTSYDKVMNGRIPDYEALYIEYTSNGWGYTTYNGYSGWVALSQTSTTPPEVPDQEVHSDNSQQNDTSAITDKNTDTNTIAVDDENTVTNESTHEKVETENTNTSNVTVVDEEETPQPFMQRGMLTQILLIAVVLVLIIIIAVLLIVIINTKSKKRY